MGKKRKNRSRSSKKCRNDMNKSGAKYSYNRQKINYLRTKLLHDQVNFMTSAVSNSKYVLNMIKGEGGQKRLILNIENDLIVMKRTLTSHELALSQFVTKNSSSMRQPRRRIKTNKMIRENVVKCKSRDNIRIKVESSRSNTYQDWLLEQKDFIDSDDDDSDDASDELFVLEELSPKGRRRNKRIAKGRRGNYDSIKGSRDDVFLDEDVNYQDRFQFAFDIRSKDRNTRE